VTRSTEPDNSSRASAGSAGRMTLGDDLMQAPDVRRPWPGSPFD
jgi:hypothetical protein